MALAIKGPKDEKKIVVDTQIVNRVLLYSKWPITQVQDGAVQPLK